MLHRSTLVSRFKSGSRSPTIFIAAHDDTGAREQALATGAFAFLWKPFTATSLLETLREILERPLPGGETG